MRTIKLLICLSVLILVGCVSTFDNYSQLNYEKYTYTKGSTIERTGSLLKSEVAPCEVIYTSNEYLVAELKKDRELLSMSKKEYRKKEEDI